MLVVRLDSCFYGILILLRFAGLSLGGYLGTRGCAIHSDRLAACLPNPPQYSVTSAYTRFVQGLAEGVYGPLQFVAQNMPGLIPDEYLDAIENDSEDIITTLLLTCNASSAAPTLILDSFVGTPGKLFFAFPQDLLLLIQIPTLASSNLHTSLGCYFGPGLSNISVQFLCWDSCCKAASSHEIGV